MDKVFQIHLAGMLFTIEEKAYQQLKSYLENLHLHFQNNQEVVMDIEARMAELFQQKLGSNRNTLFEKDIVEVTLTLGNINQMDDEGHVQNQFISDPKMSSLQGRKLRRNPFDESLGGVCSGIASFFNIDPVMVRMLFVIMLVVYGSGILLYLILWAVVPRANAEEAELMRLQRQNRSKRLFRDPDSRVIGGVSAGLANYFGFDRVAIRLIFVISIFLFGTGFWLYIVLWIIVPKAASASDKLMMKGKPVDIKNIEKEILKNQSINKVNSIAAHGANLMGLLIKGVLKLIGGFIALLLFVLVVSISIAMVALFFNLGNTGNINELIGITVKNPSVIWAAKTGILLTLVIPCVALLMLVLRSLFNLKLANKTWGITLGALFLTGIILLVYSGISFGTGIRYDGSRSDIHKLASTDTLYVSGLEMPIVEDSELNNANEEIAGESHNKELVFFDKGIVIDKDKVYLEIDNFKVKKSKGPGITLKIIYRAKGRNADDAAQHMSTINYPFEIAGNKLVLPSYFYFDKTRQFNWQELEVILFAPEGTILKFDDASKEIIDDENLDEADGEYYKVTGAGVKCTDCNKLGEENNTDQESDINIEDDSSNSDLNRHIDATDGAANVNIHMDKKGIGIKKKQVLQK